MLAEIWSDKEIYDWAWHVTAFMNPLILISFFKDSWEILVTFDFFVNLLSYNFEEFWKKRRSSTVSRTLPTNPRRPTAPPPGPAGNRRFVILPDNTALIYPSSIVFPCLRICRWHNPLQDPQILSKNSIVIGEQKRIKYFLSQSKKLHFRINF